MFDVISVNDIKERELLYIEESQYFDVKSKLISPAKLSKSISAFANASGGEIYIGIEEDTHSHHRSYERFSSIEETNKYIQILETLEGLYENYDVQYLKYKDDTFVLQITIFKTNKIVKATDNSIWIRKGAQNLECRGEKVRRLEIDKGIFVYENEIVNESDINDALDSAVYKMFSENVIPNIDKTSWLNTQKLCDNNKLKIAGTLLFTDEPQTVLPKRSAIKIFRYRTTGEGTRETMVEDPLTVDGCVYDQVYNAVKTVKEIIESLKTLGTEFNDISYPETTLHEIITNAVLHRDYSIIKDIQIRIYDNRIEVESPGKLAGHVTLKNILNEQFARNPKVVRLINKFPNPPNKDVGEGLNSAFKAMQALRLKKPEIMELENSVLVVIRHEKIASPEEIVMEYLSTHNEITNKDGRRLTGIESENIMKRVFWKLRDAKMIEMVPDRKGSKSAWRKVNTDNENECLKPEQLNFLEKIDADI